MRNPRHPSQLCGPSCRQHDSSWICAEHISLYNNQFNIKSMNKLEMPNEDSEDADSTEKAPGRLDALAAAIRLRPI